MTKRDSTFKTILVIALGAYLLLAGPAHAQFSVSERTYKKLSKVEQLMEQKNFKEAQTLLEELQSSASNRKYELTLVYQALGYLYYETSRQQKAIESFNKCLELNAAPEPVQQQIRFNLVQLYATTNDYRRAIEQFETWIKKTSSPSGDALALGGSLYAQVKQYDVAIKYLQQAIASSSPASETWYRTLLSIYFQREDHRSAAALLQELIVLHPDNREYWTQLFSSYYLLNDYQKALSTLELAYTNNLLDSEEQISNLARLYLFVGTPIKTVTLINKEFTSNRLSKNEHNLQLLADAYLQARELTESALTYTQLAQLTKKPDLYLQAARLYSEARDWNKVLETLNKAQGILNQGHAQLLKGMALVELKETGKAIEAFREARLQADTRSSANQWLDYLNTQQQLQ